MTSRERAAKCLRHPDDKFDTELWTDGDLEGRIAAAIDAAVAAERRRCADILWDYSFAGSTVIAVAGVVQDLAQQIDPEYCP